MARSKERSRGEFKLPPRLVPDFDKWGSPAEEKKTALRNEWLRATGQTDRYFFEWAPAHLAERKRLSGIGPRPPARRKGPLPEQVRRLLAGLEAESDRADPPHQPPYVEPGNEVQRAQRLRKKPGPDEMGHDKEGGSNT